MKKLKKNKKQVIVVPTTTKVAKVGTKTKKLSLPTLKKSKSRKDPVAYYGCLYEQAQAGFPNKITACCSKCKKQGTALSALRHQEIKTLITAYQQVGESLKRLLEPIAK